MNFFRSILNKSPTSAVMKRNASFLLALFVLSVLNISIQIPSHAAMKMQMQQSEMQEMSDCHCPPAICDSVLALDNQLFDNVVSISSYNHRYTGLYETLEQNPGMLNQKQHIEKLFLNVSQAAPPPLLIKTLLSI